MHAPVFRSHQQVQHVAQPLASLHVLPVFDTACTAAGVVTYDDMQIMLRQLAGSSLSDDDIACLVRKALQEAGSPEGLSLQAFQKTLNAQDLVGMTVQVPTEL